MTVKCVNSGVTYANCSDLIAAEAGVHAGQVTVELSGQNFGSATFTASDFDSVILVAASGEAFDPQTSTGARQNDPLTFTCTADIDGVSIEQLSCVYPTTNIYNSEIKAVNDVGLTYGASNTLYVYNTIIRDTYRGSYATGQNPNATLENCTLVNNSNLGLLRCNCINTVVIDCASTDYFSPVSQVNTWGDSDGSALNELAESYGTFVDYANGDVRIRADSDAGLAGAGAFIEEVVGSETYDFPIAGFGTEFESGNVTITTDYSLSVVSSGVKFESGDITVTTDYLLLTTGFSSEFEIGMVTITSNEAALTYDFVVTSIGVEFSTGDIGINVNHTLSTSGFNSEFTVGQLSVSWSGDVELNIGDYSVWYINNDINAFYIDTSIEVYYL